MMLLGKGAGPVRLGVTVFVVLMALTLLEYLLTLVMTKNLPLMIVMNVVDAGLIVYFFMHIARLWRREEEA